MARYSPGWRPARMDEKPSTGCDGVGKVMPFADVASAPDGGPAASVLAGNTARPSSVGFGVPANAFTAGSAVTAATATADASRCFLILVSSCLETVCQEAVRG